MSTPLIIGIIIVVAAIVLVVIIRSILKRKSDTFDDEIALALSNESIEGTIDASFVNQYMTTNDSNDVANKY